MKKWLIPALCISIFTVPNARAQKISNDPAQNLKILSAAPKVLSNNINDAINAILNEPEAIDGLIGPIPKALYDALVKAAIRNNVTLLSGNGSSRVPFSTRLHVKHIPADSDSSLIALKNKIVFFQNGHTQLLLAPAQAQNLHNSVQQLYQQIP